MQTEVTKVWIVTDGADDSTQVSAVYASESLANQHVELMGSGWIEEQDILTALHPDVTAPIKQAERTEAHEQAKRATAEYLARRGREAEYVANTQPRPPHMALCHCPTFTNSPRYTQHGYCSYCGGWSFPVFRKHMGEAALQSQIADLSIHDREKMLDVVAQSTV